ncbi:TetR family transcriptional regulator [Nonomuraea sp. MG754425]|uniref:TetR/AcrR family transcriptional regulator n=1 Tax=Nonomuraea sp. MG754425 TaxID=2570319 RepID=UPI001F2D159A|nr:TetR family transcriptional regulator [Nonomuraea sp. MG754425]MCF6473048.1 TetR family transcriptional regulator [Nonomuraea sp. MG754425]
MDRPAVPGASLRARKRRLAREAIIEAAHALFEERGFEKVTVSDIAERAQVGRATFFRYFGDKQEVVFADGGELDEVLAEQAAPREPISGSLPAALACTRQIVVAYVGMLTADPAAYTRHERLVASHPELQARGVIKQRRHVELLRDLLVGQGSGHDTAALAAEVGLAAFYAARAITGNRPEELPGAVGAVFDRLSGVTVSGPTT